jgi:hypothetical protein
MPQVKDGPKSLNDLLEEVYSKCMLKHKNAAMCSASAWSVAKDAGWQLGKDKKWHKKSKK